MLAPDFKKSIYTGWIWVALLTTFAGTVSGAQATKRLTLKLAHNLNQAHTVHKAAVFMDEQLAQLSDGKLRLRIYPSSQMGDAADTLQMVQHGALDMTKGSASDLEAFDKIYAVFNLPYLFENSEHFNNVIYGPAGRSIMTTTESKGFIAIAAFEAGSRSFYARKPIRNPADLKGMKVRVQASATTIEMIRLLGGSPTPIPYADTYTALQQGVVDMAENNIPSFVDTRHFEVAKFFSEDQHSSIPDYLIIATKTWKEKLTEEQRNMLKAAAERAEAYQRQLWSEAVNNARNSAQKAGVTFIEVDKRPFRDATAPLYKKFAADTQQAELLKKIQMTATTESKDTQTASASGKPAEGA